MGQILTVPNGAVGQLNLPHIAARFVTNTTLVVITSGFISAFTPEKCRMNASIVDSASAGWGLCEVMRATMLGMDIPYEMLKRQALAILCKDSHPIDLLLEENRVDEAIIRVLDASIPTPGLHLTLEGVLLTEIIGTAIPILPEGLEHQSPALEIPMFD